MLKTGHPLSVVGMEAATRAVALGALVAIILLGLAVMIPVIRWFLAERERAETKRVLGGHKGIHGLPSDLLSRITAFYLPQTACDAGSQAASKGAPKRRPLWRLTDDFLRPDSGFRCLVVFGAAGMGKTSFLVNYLVRNEKKPSGREPMTLIALGQSRATEQIAALDESTRQKSVLLLDSLHEDPGAAEDPGRRLLELLELSRDFRRVIITCRNEIFPSLDDAPDELPSGADGAAYKLKQVLLQPFTPRQVAKFLRRVFPIWFLHRRMAGKRIAHAVGPLGGSPLVLSYMPDLVSAPKNPVKLTDIFQVIVTAWLRHEQRWAHPDTLLAFAQQLSLTVQRNRWEKRGSSVGRAVYESLARDVGLDLTKWRTTERSLLIRDAESRLGFVHGAFAEYLFVPAFLGMSADQRKAWLDGRVPSWTSQMKDFALGGFAAPGADLSYTDLRACDLGRFDLSGCRFVEANLTDANLAGARLVETDLRDARLGHTNFNAADLSRADLTGAQLGHADFGGANLTGATFDGADMRGANLEGAELKAAALGSARIDAASLRPVAPPSAQWDGEILVEPATGMRFVWIPGNRFQMGGKAELNESPIHWVRLSSFWFGETPVTNRQYGKFLVETGYRQPEYWQDPRFSDPDQPVVGVSFEDAKEFCRWLGSVSGLAATLPSEAEWEYAARGTDGRDYPWGKHPGASRACFGEDASTGRPAKVGAFPAGKGPFGTLDQAGTVWEWCLDVWDEMAYLKRAGKELVDPVVAAGEPGVQVVRGGSWFFPAEDLRAPFRGRNRAASRDDDLGFRVAAAPCRQRLDLE
jgi:formylglycine-generating enzyme required for sulfatase activity